MGLLNSIVITAGDMQFYPNMLAAADRYEGRPGDQKMDALVDEFDIRPIFSY